MSGTFYDDPNREAVGLPPIWGAPPPPPEGRASKSAGKSAGKARPAEDDAEDG